MLIAINANELANAARIASLVISSGRNSLLKCCRLTAGGNLRIYGTDLDTGISALADCDVIEPGKAVVDAQRLADIAAKLKGDVRIEENSGDLIIICGRSRFRLPMMATEDYPPSLAVDDDSPSVALTPADVMALFDGAAGGAAQDDKRIYLSGPVLFSESTDFGHRLCGVGADSVALSYAATAIGCPDLGQGVIVHRETCKVAVDLFGKTGASLRLSENLVELTSDSMRLTAKIIDHTPSAWRSMVPSAAANSALVKASDFVAALGQCAAVYNNLTGDATKRAPSVRIRWDAGGEDFHVSYGDIRTAPAALVTVPDMALSGKADISIDPKKLMRLLDGIDGAAVEELGGAVAITLSTGDRPGDPLRIDGGPDRYAVLGQIREFSHISEEAA